jgi:hypothetical protein
VLMCCMVPVMRCLLHCAADHLVARPELIGPHYRTNDLTHAKVEWEEAADAERQGTAADAIAEAAPAVSQQYAYCSISKALRMCISVLVPDTHFRRCTPAATLPDSRALHWLQGRLGAGAAPAAAVAQPHTAAGAASAG